VSAHAPHDALDALYRSESRRVLATLIRLLGDFDLAEEAMHEAFHVAVEQWPRDGVPANPVAWLVSTGRFRAIDKLRTRARFDARLDAIATTLEQQHREQEEQQVIARDDDTLVQDDRLRLVFTCCHPALARDARIALTLREVCGLTTEEIARAFLTTPSTVAQRIVRAKAKIRDARIPYEIPDHDELAARLDSVLQVIYLVFNEGYSASHGDAVTRHTLTDDAIRLARTVVELLPESESVGLLALLLLHESRRATRATADGAIVLLTDQDRTQWDRAMIDEGLALVRRALTMARGGQVGQYAIQSAIAAVHADAPSAGLTDWDEIVGLYDLLLGTDPAPVVELNRAVAVAMRDGPEAGLVLIDALFARGELDDYLFAHAARADLCRRLGRDAEARAAYERALALAQQGPERRFLEGRIANLPPLG
jgi:RNA polymerase sigma-70 factor (ECF subfamily)